MLKISSSTPFARPANTTPYASGDLVANHVTAGSVIPGNIGVHPTAGGLGRIRRVHLLKSNVVLTAALFRIHFYRDAPVVSSGDNGPWESDHAGYLGSFDVTCDRAFISGAAISAMGIGLPVPAGEHVMFDLPDEGLGSPKKRIYFLIEARGAYVPGSAEAFTVTAEIDYEKA